MARYVSKAARPVLGLVAVLFLGLAAPAFGQKIETPKIGIVDVQRVLSEAKAAKGIRPEIERLRKDFQDQVRDQEKALRKAEQDLSQERALLSRDAFNEKRRAFSERASQAQRDVQERRKQLDEAFNKTKNEILNSLVDVAQEVARAKGLNIVMEKRFVFISAKTLDITNDVLKALDKRLPKVTIEVKGGKKQGGTKGKP